MYNFSKKVKPLSNSNWFKITKKLPTAIHGMEKRQQKAKQKITKEDASIMISWMPKKSYVSRQTASYPWRKERLYV